MIESILNTEVSGFSNYNDTKPKNLNLLTFLISDKYSSKVDKIRSIENKKERDKIKCTLPAITPAATLKTRAKNEADKVLSFSGFAQFDIDTKGNESVNDWEQVKAEIIKFPFVAYCGLSVSGRGLWGLVPVSDPTNLKQHFNSLLVEFKNIGIELDISKGKNPTDLRGYSYDKNAYYNHSAETFLSKVIEKPKTNEAEPTTKPKVKTDFSNKSVNELMNEKIKELTAAPDGTKWETLRQVAYTLGGLVTGQNLNRNDALNELNRAVKSLNNVNDEDKAIETMIKSFEDGEAKPYVNKYEKEKKPETWKYWEFKPAPQPQKLEPLPPIKMIQSTAFEAPVKEPIKADLQPLETMPQPQQTKPTQAAKVDNFKLLVAEDWSKEVDRLELELMSLTIGAKEPIQLNAWSKIHDVNSTIDVLLHTIRANNGKRTFLPYLDQLREVHQYFLSNK